MATIVAIFINKNAGDPMTEVTSVAAIEQSCLHGDLFREPRRVSFISAEAFEGTGLEFAHARHNVVIEGIDTGLLLGREFMIGSARFRGAALCTSEDIQSELHGLMTEVTGGGMIKKGDEIRILPYKE